MQKHIPGVKWRGSALQGLIALTIAILILPFVRANSAFAASKSMTSTQQSHILQRPSLNVATLPCTPGSDWQDQESSIGTQAVLGGTIEIDDVFHQAGCLSGTDHYVLDGSAQAYWTGLNPAQASSIMQSGTVTINGIGVSVSLPAGAGFNPTSSSAFSYSAPAVSNTSNSSFTYNNVVVSALSVIGFEQVDNAQFTFGNNTYNAQSQVDLSASGPGN